MQKPISELLGLRTEDAYKRARKTLEERFGDPFRIYEAYRDKLRNWTPCVTSADLQEFSDFLIMMQETMKSVKYLKELESYSIIRELAARLPTFYGNKWRESAKKLEAKCGEYCFTNFVEFTQEASLDANHPVFSHVALTSTRKELEKERNPHANKTRQDPDRTKKKRHGISLNTTGSESSCKDPPGANLCVLCKGKHGLSTCKSFLERPFMILPVWIHHKNYPDRRVKVYAVLDDHSDTCFVTDDVMDKLGVTGPVIKLELGTMHAIEKINTQRSNDLVVSRFDGKVDIPLPKAYTRTHIPGQRGQIPRRKLPASTST